MRRRDLFRAAAAAVPTSALLPGVAQATEPEKVLVAAGDMNRRQHVQATGLIAKAARPDLVLTLGDQQYPCGSLPDYRQGYGTTHWGDLKAITRPVPGHHEYDTPGASGYFDFFDVPPWYAYPIGLGWRGYALNSHVAIAAQCRWLRADLAAHPGRRVVASWSDPRWSSGTRHGNEADMQPFLDALQGRRGIVLNGHEHHYERFAVRDGLRQFVVGTAGWSGYPFGPPVPGSRVRITEVPGVLVLRLRRGGYTWAFQDMAGRTRDAGPRQPQVSAPAATR